jgi:Mycothiol maleylpyruvate isomerase N-terminal domain
MYADALEFLEDEREAWRPFEALLELTDEQLAVPLETAHGWSGRDLMAHLTSWQGVALSVAQELAVHDTSAIKVRSDADWDARGDAINEEIRVSSLALPMAELRDRFRQIPGELRGYLTVVPETRWLKNSEYERFFLDETTDHYASHLDDLAAVLASVSAAAV